MRQFFLATDPDQLPRPGDQVTLGRDESHHLSTVLRGGRDLVIELVDGRGHRMTGRPCGRDGKTARIEILTLTRDIEEFREPRLVVACAVVKGKRFEWALEKAVELGAHEFLPLETDLGVIDPRPGKQDRWRSIMTAALKQSGRSYLPFLSEPLPVKDVLARCSAGPVYFGAAPADGEALRSGAPFWTDILDEGKEKSPSQLTVLIGPEGGWSPAELSLLSRDGTQAISMGPHVLRTETAVLTGLAILQALRDRWGSD
ncbi:MAG: RsmE family RNA methyltransferase [Candidatus Krumholzibacteriota bacterium]